ncbi:hypothetical protein Hanom_Chr14g01251781 [Helianthus anomalus]
MVAVVGSDAAPLLVIGGITEKYTVGSLSKPKAVLTSAGLNAETLAVSGGVERVAMVLDTPSLSRVIIIGTFIE